MVVLSLQILCNSKDKENVVAVQRVMYGLKQGNWSGLKQNSVVIESFHFSQVLHLVSLSKKDN
tara:strand:- start:551 stop:739 length:189 start_codon:yes stop_codon:yes gene_type:complete